VATSLAGEGWDRATVYRNLIALTDAGLLRRTDLGDHTWRFELQRHEPPGEAAVHPHFLCDACGDVVCLPGGAVQVVAARGTPRAIQRRKYEVQIKGRCDDCEWRIGPSHAASLTRHGTRIDTRCPVASRWAPTA
jgi:Fur family ferric uptake transcriptional regulator